MGYYWAMLDAMSWESFSSDAYLGSPSKAVSSTERFAGLEKNSERL